MRILIFMLLLIWQLKVNSQVNQAEPDKNTCVKIAQKLLKQKHENNQIWGLIGIEPKSFELFYDNFLSPESKNYLVQFAGWANGSSGGASFLLFVLEWNKISKNWQVKWYQQSGMITDNSIKDIDGDGVKEFISKYTSIWMGECNQLIYIFSLKEAREKEIYKSITRSFLDCGMLSLSDRFVKGDTLSTNLQIELGNNEIIENFSYKIHNGGKNDKEILKNLKTFKSKNKIVLN